MGGRTDDHEYRGSHHQTPGTLQGGRTDAQRNDWLEGVKARAASKADRYTTLPTTDWEGVIDCFEMGERLYAEQQARLVAVEDAQRAVEAKLAYIASEYECYCETPGTSNDCAVCQVRAIFAAADTGQGTKTRIPGELDPADGA